MRAAKLLRTSAACLALCVAAAAIGQSAAPPASPPPVPHDHAAYRSIAFANDIATILWMDIAPGKNSDYHIHTKDMICVVMDDFPPEAYTQKLGGPPGTPRKPKRGELSYVTYYGNPTVTHRDVNAGTLFMHQICLELNRAQPQGYAPGLRNGGGYVQELDNSRVRGWRLSLAPGETAPQIEQKAPGIRLVIDGGEIAEVTPDKHERNIVLRPDHAYWQEKGAVRSVRNVGSTRIELIELEFK